MGLKTAYDINQYWADNWLGVKTGRGFYNYPNPEYAASGFLNAGG